MKLPFELSRPDSLAGDLWKACADVEAAAVSDVLQRRGLSRRVMRADIQNFADGARIRGLARTIASRPRELAPEPGREYGLLFSAIDGISAGDVLVTDEMNCCVWGELCTERAMKRGANGAAIDGYYRDARRVKNTGFPVFSRGRHLSDMLYHREIISIDGPVISGGVYVAPGDLIVGDDDGIVVVPAAMIAAVIMEAVEKTRIEGVVRGELRQGASAQDVYKKFGVL